MKLGRVKGVVAVATVILMSCLVSQTQDKRKIIIDQDAAGPAGTDQQAILLLIQSPQTEVLGITVVTGDAWLTEEVAHTLRMLELIGRTDIPVLRGAEYPLVRTKEETEQWEQRYGSVAWLGAWTPRVYHAPRELGAMPEGKPTSKAADEDAAHFLVFMGASLNPQTADPEFANNPRHEFNFWFDPEAARIVLRAQWKKIVCTPVDISLKTRMTNELIEKIKAGNSPSAKYIGKYARLRGSYNYLWDELTSAAWLDPSLITKKENRYMDVNLDRGPGYGDTLTWTDRDKPKREVQSVEVQFGLDTDKFYRMFVELLTAPTPRPGKPSTP